MNIGQNKFSAEQRAKLARVAIKRLIEAEALRLMAGGMSVDRVNARVGMPSVPARNNGQWSWELGHAALLEKEMK